MDPRLALRGGFNTKLVKKIVVTQPRSPFLRNHKSGTHFAASSQTHDYRPAVAAGQARIGNRKAQYTLYRVLSRADGRMRPLSPR